MNKIKVYIDFDNTLVNSNKAIVTILNKKYGTKKRYKKMYRSDFKDLFPNVQNEDIHNIYESQELFDNLKLFDGCREAILYFEDLVEPIILTTGSEKNAELKENFFSYMDLPIERLICLKYDGTCKEKSRIDMSDSIIIDDNIEVLRNTNAKIKILFTNGVDAQWNEVKPNDEIYIVNTWNDIGDIIKFYADHQEVF